MIPYYKKPTHIKLDEILSPLDNFLNAIDELYELRILGGEPFLYPSIGELLDACGKLSKVKRIVIYTNSTVIPENMIFERMKENHVVLHMSDYGTYSGKVKEIQEKCLEYGVDTAEKRKELMALLYERDIFSACYYCNGNSIHAKPIAAAVQL